MPVEYVDVKKFKKVVLLYNRNSGKQLFASMMSKVNETFKRIKAVVGAKNAEMGILNILTRFPRLLSALLMSRLTG